MRKFPSHPIAALAAALTLSVAFTGLCHGQGRVISQFDARAGGFEPQGNGTTRWMSKGIMLNFSEDWEIDAMELRNVVGAEGRGFWPEPGIASNITISAGAMVVKPTARNVRMALFTGEHGGVVRLANRPGGGEAGIFETTGVAENVRVWVNGQEGAPLQPGVWQVVSFAFSTEVPLENARVCGDPGLASWRRTFEGAVASVVLFGGGEVSEDTLRGVENILGRRFGVEGVRSATEVERKAAMAAKINDFGIWRSLFILK